eukprot:TRINITY_DN6487_c1_g1_i1.p1 TRINITY_DN6487_c1_g1~~TRINITY_DN6487_c1_g1_i1.p1  ORF type:complete len:661 (+),score=112.03 TRINITY_DN6487_c1_g1_i1:68-1984(+)
MVISFQVVARLALTMLSFANYAASSGFLQGSPPRVEEVQAQLLNELKGSLRPGGLSDRFTELEDVIWPMYTALPKDKDGKLPHSVVRYALHRVLEQQHGWFVKGLEPGPEQTNASAWSSMKEWVPSYMQQFLESRFGGNSGGLGLHELAVIAATIEDLIFKEASQRLAAVYNLFNIPLDSVVNASRADGLVDSFMLVMHKGGDWKAESAEDGIRRTRNFKRNHRSWSQLDAYLRDLRVKATGKDNSATYTFADVERVVKQIVSRYGFYIHGDCRSMQQELWTMEDKQSGRVLLKSFYEKALIGRWAFTEKVDYLRVLGALDESDPNRPRVIMTNYVLSRPQCMEASNFYAFCCPNDCEGLINKLESKLEQPTVEPERLAELVSSLSTDIVQQPGKLPQMLLNRLDQVAANHGGRVPLHGRLFAQWMHHVFPRYCPFPHQSGTVSVQTPDEWMQGTGQDSSTASEEEMVCHVSGPCAGGASALEGNGIDASSTVSYTQGDVAEEVMIPWSDAEELLVTTKMEMLSVATPAAERLHAFNTILRVLLLSGVSLGLAIWAKQPELDVRTPSKRRHPQVWATLTLLLLPLIVITADVLFFFANVGSELVLVGACWGLAAMLVSHLRSSSGLSCMHLEKAKWAV